MSQKRLYLFYTEDGFIDLAIGFVFLIFGLSLLANLSWMIGFAGILPALGWYIAKQTITQRRTGIIIPKPSMKRRFRDFYLILIIFGILSFGVIISSIASNSFILQQYPLSMLGIILALGISGLAILLHTGRFYIHAVILFFGMTIGEILNTNSNNVDTFILFTIIAASIILCIGFFITIRFLKTYPPIGNGGNE